MKLSSMRDMISNVVSPLSNSSPRFLKVANVNSWLFHSDVTDRNFASISFSFVAAIQMSWKKIKKILKKTVWTQRGNMMSKWPNENNIIWLRTWKLDMQSENIISDPIFSRRVCFWYTFIVTYEVSSQLVFLCFLVTIRTRNIILTSNRSSSNWKKPWNMKLTSISSLFSSSGASIIFFRRNNSDSISKWCFVTSLICFQWRVFIDLWAINSRRGHDSLKSSIFFFKSL